MQAKSHMSHGKNTSQVHTEAAININKDMNDGEQLAMPQVFHMGFQQLAVAH